MFCTVIIFATYSHLHLHSYTLFIIMILITISFILLLLHFFPFLSFSPSITGTTLIMRNECLCCSSFFLPSLPSTSSSFLPPFYLSLHLPPFFHLFISLHFYISTCLHIFNFNFNFQFSTSTLFFFYPPPSKKKRLKKI